MVDNGVFHYLSPLGLDLSPGIIRRTNFGIAYLMSFENHPTLKLLENF